MIDYTKADNTKAISNKITKKDLVVYNDMINKIILSRLLFKENRFQPISTRGLRKIQNLKYLGSIIEANGGGREDFKINNEKPVQRNLFHVCDLGGVGVEGFSCVLCCFFFLSQAGKPCTSLIKDHEWKCSAICPGEYLPCSTGNDR
uniref:Uncharacterized protein n=1 Tax=Timema poppense TaxID=170557 RepID=A0A7R9D670_TIMPO|nr:unnamed protein product [Timema poppensis]